MHESTPTPGRGTQTRESLLAAAIRVFARDGFSAASTRSLAAEAGVNQALIQYHFGGKQGLYEAVFEQLLQHLAGGLEPLAGQMRSRLDQLDGRASRAARREALLPPLFALCDAWLHFLFSPPTQDFSQLILREQQRPTAVFTRIYEGFMEPMLGLLTRCWQELSGLPPKECRPLVITLVGQLLVWRVAAAGVTRFVGWEKLGDAERELASRVVRSNVLAMLAVEGESR